MCIDKAKGIIAKSMPDYWYNPSKNRPTEGDSDEELQRKAFNMSICAEKKPYFTNYIYPEQMAEYKQYVKSANRKCIMLYHMTLDELMALEEKTEEQEEFIKWYRLKYPVSDNGCVMNRICHRIEQEFDGYFKEIKSKSEFDYTIMKSGVEYSKNDYRKIHELYNTYLKRTQDFKIKSNQKRIKKDDIAMNYMMLTEEFKRECVKICPNEDELCDIILDMCYKSTSSKQFAWEICIDTIIKNLLRNNNNELTYLYRDDSGDVTYCGEKFSVARTKVGNDDDNTE